MFHWFIDQAILWASRAAALLAATLMAWILVFLALEAWPAARDVGIAHVFTDSSWHPRAGRFNLLPMATATALTSLLAVSFAAPLGLASAIFGRFYAPRGLAVWHRRLVEVLAGIPSVVFGLWGLVVMVPIVAALGGSGQGLLSAALILSLMILPTVALTADAALGAVPAELLQGAAALGLPRWACIRRVALPVARRGIQAGVLLATARALGETMAVLMVAGNVPQYPTTINAAVRTMTANIALEIGYAGRIHRSMLFLSGLVLVLAVGSVFALSDLFRRRTDHERS